MRGSKSPFSSLPVVQVTFQYPRLTNRLTATPAAMLSVWNGAAHLFRLCPAVADAVDLLYATPSAPANTLCNFDSSVVQRAFLS